MTWKWFTDARGGERMSELATSDIWADRRRLAVGGESLERGLDCHCE